MSLAQAQTRGSEAKHIRLLGHACQQKTAQIFVQAIESESKQYLQHLIARQPSKPRGSAIRGVINNLEVEQRDGVLLQSLQLSFFQSHKLFFFFFFFGYRIVVHSFQAKEPSGHQTNLRYAGTTA